MLSRKKFDLMVLDYCLPEMTGGEFCRKIRDSDLITPIVFYTALFREVDRERAMEAGANAYVIKPDEFGLLAATVRQLLPSYDRPRRLRYYQSPRGRSSAII